MTLAAGARSDAEQRWADREQAFRDELLLAWIKTDAPSYDVMSTLARGECRLNYYNYAARTATEQQLLDAQMTQIHRHFVAVVPGVCWICFGGPVVVFVDGYQLDWPARTPHECRGLAPAPVTRAEPKRQPVRPQPKATVGAAPLRSRVPQWR